MPAPVHDPVHRATYTFEPDGDNLWVEMRLEPGGGLPPHLHPTSTSIGRSSRARFAFSSARTNA